MKIIDYGLWYTDGTGMWMKNPKLKEGGKYDMYFNGRKIFYGNISGSRHYSLDPRRLPSYVGVRLNSAAPGHLASDWRWEFPEGYVPTEYDFEGIE